MPFITDLASNVKGEFRYALGKKTLIVGKNRAGKTKITEAVAMVLTGYPRTQYLTRYKHEMMALKPVGSPSLWVQAQFSDGGTGSWVCEGSTSGTKDKVLMVSDGQGRSIKVPAGKVMSDTFRDLLQGDGKKLSYAIVSAFAPSVTIRKLIDDCPVQLADRLSDYIKLVLKDYKEKAKGVEEDTEIDPQFVIDLIVKVDRAVYAVRKERDGYKIALDQLNNEPLTDEEERALGFLQAALSAREVREEAKTKVIEQLQMVDSELSELKGKLQEKGDKIRKQVKLFSLASSIIDIVTGITSDHDADQCTCPTCQTENVNVSSFKKAKEQIDKGIEYYAEESAMVDRIKELASQKESLEGYVREMSGDIRYGELGENEEEVIEKVNELNQRRVDTERAVSLKEMEFQSDENLNQCKGLSSHLTGVIRHMLRESRKSFIDSCNTFLPEGFELDLIIRAGKRDVCHLAFSETAGMPYLAGGLSGAEQALLSVATASALAKSSNDYAKILIIDDVWLDPDQLENSIKAIDSVVGIEHSPIDQVFLCSVSSDIEVGDDWIKIEL